jgi:hypothetical protein
MAGKIPPLDSLPQSEQVADHFPETLRVYGLWNVVIRLGGHTVRVGVSGGWDCLTNGRQENHWYFLG